MNNYYFSFEFNRFFLKNNFFEPLFLLNNIRFNYISKRITLKKKKILDLGCGLGLLSEKLAIHGGLVTGIDKSDLLIKFAFKNAEINKLSINYICCDFLSIEKFDFKFDIIICTEVLEHLDDIFNFFIFLIKLVKKYTYFYFIFK
ncbi:MAG TPA: methyltransferase domain-containing protein [Candidatus Azoamicus sp.]